MSHSTLLQIVQRFARLRNLVPPTSVVTSTDDTILQVWELLNSQTIALAEMYSWQELKRAVQFAPSPVSFSGVTYGEAPRTININPVKYPLRMTLWSLSQRLPVAGPLSDAQWQTTIQLQVAPAQFSYRWFQDVLQIYPYVAPVTEGLPTFTLEYESEYAVESTTLGGDDPIRLPTLRWESDDAKSYLPDRLVEAGLIWRWKAEKGLPYGQDQDDYDMLCLRAFANDGNSGVIRLSNDPEYPQAISPGILIPAGNWNR